MATKKRTAHTDTITTIRDTIAKELYRHNFIATPYNDIDDTDGTDNTPFIRVEITAKYKGKYYNIILATLRFKEDKINIGGLSGSYPHGTTYTIIYADPDMLEKLITTLEKLAKEAIDEYSNDSIRRKKSTNYQRCSIKLPKD
jgi:hypothetical protein